MLFETLRFCGLTSTIRLGWLLISAVRIVLSLQFFLIFLTGSVPHRSSAMSMLATLTCDERSVQASLFGPPETETEYYGTQCHHPGQSGIDNRHVWVPECRRDGQPQCGTYRQSGHVHGLQD